MDNRKLAIVRGGGDLATGIIFRLWKVGFSVLSLDIAAPLVVRRTVSVAEAVYEGKIQIEDMKASLIRSADEFDRSFDGAQILVDPEGKAIERLHPDLVVDAIMAKRRTTTNKSMAPIVLAIGPGFTAPDDVHAVIETKRGHTLGRVIYNGTPIPNTGVPGIIRGYGIERLLRAPADGHFESIRTIGDEVTAGTLIGTVNGEPVYSQLDGVVRGLIHPSAPVTKGLKIGDVDPRGDPAHCWSISDKALSVGGGVLEAVMHFGIR